MSLRASYLTMLPTRVGPAAELPRGERPPPTDRARAARRWPAIALAAVLAIALGAAAGAPTRASLVAAGLIFLMLSVVMRAEARRETPAGQRAASGRPEGR
jgi:hypothetical protein